MVLPLFPKMPPLLCNHIAHSFSLCVCLSLCVSLSAPPSSLPSYEELRGHVEEPHVVRNYGKSLELMIFLADRQQGALSPTISKNLNSANNQSEPMLSPSPVRSRMRPQPSQNFEVLWDTKQKIQLSHTQTPTHRNCKRIHVSFY